MTNGQETGQRKAEIDLGALVHATAGIVALIMGALMYFYNWALPVFAGLMILSAVSAVIISWRQDAWVPGHWLAMLPVLGIGAGYFGADWGYTLAYACLWIAFIHFVIRGIQQMRDQRAA